MTTLRARDERGRYVRASAIGGPSLDINVIANFGKVMAAAERATFRNLGHAAATIAKEARSSITKNDSPSEPGDPPHTKGKGGHNLRGSIRFSSGKEEAVVGPIESYVGTSAAAHEHGGEHEGQEFPERPFMRPALENNLDRFTESWKHSLTE